MAGLQAEGQNGGAVVADPLFTDAAGGDFSLRPDSPVKAIGFRPFDWRSVGPRLKTRRPDDYGDYAKQFPVPSLEVPVVRTRIELLTPPADVQSTGLATFAVTLSNVGRAEGRGAIRLAGGPRGAAGGRLSLRRIAFALAPGAEQVAQVTMKVKRGTHTYWLDSEPADGVTVPARALQFDPAACRWQVRRVAEVPSPDAVGAALAAEWVHAIRHGDRLVAEVRLGATAEALLFSARFHEPALRPDCEQPWRGTGFELIVYQPTPAAAAGQPPSKRQVFIVPRAAGQGADGFTLAAAGDRTEPAKEIRASSRPQPGGCDVAALIPWHHLGCDARPDQCACQLVVDAIDPAIDAVVQLLAFDLPTGPGNVPLRGGLRIETGE